MSSAGDVNGDGIDNMIVGEPYGAGANSGRAYVIFGRSAMNPFGDSFDLTDIDGGSNGLTIVGAPTMGPGIGTWPASASAAAGDINNDGFRRSPGRRSGHA